jgi:hypothetical protein
VATGKLKLNFYDASFERIEERMEIRLDHTVLNDFYEVPNKNKNKRVFLKGINSSQGGRYVLWIKPERYRSSYRLIQVLEDPAKNEEHLVLAVRPSSVRQVTFPAFNSIAPELNGVLANSDIESHPGLKGEALYDALETEKPPLRKAGLFNLYTKMAATILPNTKKIFSYVESMFRLRGDRMFARVGQGLRDEIKNACLSGLFRSASGSLHTPPPGFQHAGSFKSAELYGNLQLTFFCKPSTLEFVIDADIDDAGGLQHIFQVTEHLITGAETHPFDIHQILTRHQKLHPGYKLVV